MSKRPRKTNSGRMSLYVSDQYNDSVTINGINYGSTPVEIVLPAGRHQVTVAKDGYETYNRVITVNGNDTVWVKLRPNKDS